MPKQRKRGIKGAGSVYQRKSDNRYVGSFMIEETGKRKYIYADTEKEAWELLQKAQQEQKQGILATGPKQKLETFLTQWFTEVHRPPLIRPSSHARYVDVATNHILPILGHFELQKITPQRVHAFYIAKLKEGQSANSLRLMKSVLTMAFDTAVKWRLVSYNPCKGVSIPLGEAQREAVVLTEEQARQLLQVARGGKVEAFIILALSTGLRHGELAALRWRDIDLEQGIVDVNSTVSYLSKEFYERDPKSKSGKRKILIPLEVCTMLRVHQEKQRTLREEAGSKWREQDLVFCTSTGSFVQPNVQLYRFYRLLEKAHLPKMHIHDLRHSAASFLIAMGVNLKVVQEILGHSTLDMTMNVYSHVLPSMQKDAREKMSVFFQEVSIQKENVEQEEGQRKHPKKVEETL
jgi:integrase